MLAACFALILIILTSDVAKNHSADNSVPIVSSVKVYQNKDVRSIKCFNISMYILF